MRKQASLGRKGRQRFIGYAITRQGLCKELENPHSGLH